MANKFTEKRDTRIQSCCFANTKKVLVIKNTKYFFAVLKRGKQRQEIRLRFAGYTSVWKLRNYINDKIKKKK